MKWDCWTTDPAVPLRFRFASRNQSSQLGLNHSHSFIPALHIMPDVSAPADKKVQVLKGQEAEDTVLKYLKRINRPYGAADVSANLKGAVTKPATQKILAALAEKNLITQKAYGKTNIYLARQDELEDMPPEKLQQMQVEHEELMHQVKARAAEAKQLNQDLVKIRSTPTDDDLRVGIVDAKMQNEEFELKLAGLRTGAAPVSEEELAALDAEWDKWRGEWVRRKKVWKEIWFLLTEALTPHEAHDLEESLGLEQDSEELAAVEKRV
ncbi:TBPIP-domain-containing protein [Auriculariales sp. MPI-PUGE-AT-0066]|nr:TBPIP-domain-containing protein [Auriculariales sp. MPI-PUGE-AT-0066]